MATTRLAVDAGAGRVLAVAHSELDGRPVVISHGGTPSGLADNPAFERLATAAELAVIAFNRPGYGSSTRRPGRTVASCADDTACVLDVLGVNEFVSIGVSGGGPHALADAALLPGRCRGVVEVSGLAPIDAAGLDFLEGMSDSNKMVFGMTDEAAVAALGDVYAAMLGGVTQASLVESASTMFPPVDAAFVQSPEGQELMAFFAAAMADGFSSGSAGFADDVLAMTRPWGFDVGSITAPLRVWHGELDENAPVAHGRWVASTVAGAVAHFLPEHGHISITAEMPSFVADLAELAHGR